MVMESLRSAMGLPVLDNVGAVERQGDAASVEQLRC